MGVGPGWLAQVVPVAWWRVFISHTSELRNFPGRDVVRGRQETLGARKKVTLIFFHTRHSSQKI